MCYEYCGPDYFDDPEKQAAADADYAAWCDAKREEEEEREQEEANSEKALSEIISDRVQLGIEFLNEDLGEGWPYDVSTTKLDLSSSMWCVIGQLYASRPEGFDGWNKFVLKFGKDLVWMTSHGFDDIQSTNYGYLTREWKIEIEKLTKP
jgi:hypothetical protein